MQSFKIIGLLVLEKKTLKVFAIYVHEGHLGHVTCTIYINFLSHFSRRLLMKFGIDTKANWFQRRCLKIMVIYM